MNRGTMQGVAYRSTRSTYRQEACSGSHGNGGGGRGVTSHVPRTEDRSHERKAGLKDMVSAVAAGSNGLLFDGAHDGSIRVRLGLNGKEVACIENSCGPVVSMCLSESFLYAGFMDGTLKVWDLYSWRHLATQQGRHGPVWCLVSDGDEFVYSGMNDGRIFLWAAPTKRDSMQLRCVLSAHAGPVYSMVFHHDCLYSAGADGFVKVWTLGIRKRRSLGEQPESVGRRQVPVLRKQESDATNQSTDFPGFPFVPVSPPGYGSQARPRFFGREVGSSSQMQGSQFGRLSDSMHDLTTATPPQQRQQPLKFSDKPSLVAVYEGHGAEVLSLVVFAGHLCSGDRKGVVKMWKFWTREQAPWLPQRSKPAPCIHTLTTGTQFVRALAVDGDVLFIAVGGEIHARRYTKETPDFHLLDKWKAHNRQVLSLAVSKTAEGPSTLISGGLDGGVKVWWSIGNQTAAQRNQSSR